MRPMLARPYAPQLAPPFPVEVGRCSPLGAIPDAEGVNFSLFSQHASSVTLLLFESHESVEPFQTIRFDPLNHKTFYFWHAYVRGLKPGVHYAYRVAGPFDPAVGHRFDTNKVLIDPYSRGISKAQWQRSKAVGPGDNLPYSFRSVVADMSGYDWEGDSPPQVPMRNTIIYEMHVGGFTRSPSSGVKHPGTFSGMIEKIPYLQQLGVTAVELLPVFDFDEAEVEYLNPTNGSHLENYWGYNTVSYFAPHSGFCQTPEQGTSVQEFRDMVKALHAAGIEVILDVVFNHTCEGNHKGPTISFKGLDNKIYYHLEPNDPSLYRNFSGCGNTLNCNHPVVEKFILDCLRFWVTEMHVDGFRFDEGSILSRGEDGVPMIHPPVVWNIELTDDFAYTKIIAEAWDAAGLYQIGYFPGRRWAEWNGRYRDDVRRFVRGERGLVSTVASRIAGSADIYQARNRFPINSINFITCHDGFTLNDLVSYNEKHNLENGEENRDGVNDNCSWNCGVEGETKDLAIELLRNRQVKNLLTVLMLSQGVPMILSGDEVRKSQRGNNNAYCQNNELSWFDWELVDRHHDVFRFFQRMIAFRKSSTTLTRRRFFTGELNERGMPDIAWHGCDLHAPGFKDPNSGVLAFTLGGSDGDDDLHVMMNMEDQALEFQIPELRDRSWHRFVDTSKPPGEEITELEAWPLVTGSRYWVGPYSVVILVSKDAMTPRLATSLERIVKQA